MLVRGKDLDQLFFNFSGYSIIAQFDFMNVFLILVFEFGDLR